MVLSATIRKRFVEVAIEVPPGVTILFGPSGSGKTTILDCIAGLQPLDAGRVALDEEVLSEQNVSIRRIGYVLQSLALFPHLTVLQNVEYGLRRSARRREAAMEALAAFRIEALAGRHPRALSGGEMQRVALARTLVTEPRLLLLDEPLSALDEPTRAQIAADLVAWNATRRIPMLYVTHQRAEAFALGERLLLLERGRVVKSGQEALAELAGYENVLAAEIVAEHPEDGTMTCRIGDLTLEVPLAPGAPVKVAVRAGDIIVAMQPPAGLSAQNILPGTLRQRERHGVTEVLTVRCGNVDFTVHVTPAAATRLGLAPETPVWLVIKSRSCQVVRAAPRIGDD